MDGGGPGLGAQFFDAADAAEGGFSPQAVSSCEIPTLQPLFLYIKCDIYHKSQALLSMDERIEPTRGAGGGGRGWRWRVDDQGYKNQLGLC